MAVAGAVRNIGVGLESTPGTLVTPTHWIPIEEGYVNPVVEYDEDQSNYGRQESPVSSDVVAEDAEFKGKAVVRNDWIGVLLAQIIGEPTSALAGGESAVWEHTFSYENDVAHTPMSMIMKSAIADEASAYSMVKSLTFTINAKSLLRVDIETIGRQLATDSNTVAYATSAAYKFKGSGATVKLGAAITNLSGATATKFHEISIKITPSILPHHVFNSITLDKTINQTLEVEIELKKVKEDNTFRDYFTDGTVKALQLDCTNSATIGSADNPQLRFQFAELSFEGYEETPGLREVVMETITCKAHFDPSESTPQMLNILLVNEEDGSNFTTA